MHRLRSTLGRVPWRQIIFGGLSLVAIIYVAISASTVEAVAVAVGIVAAVLAVWNPFAVRPRPTLSLAVNGNEQSEIEIGVRRPLDTAALVADAKRSAANAAPPQGSLWYAFPDVARYAKPTQLDYVRFAATVDQYGDAVAQWLDDVDRWRRDRALLLEAVVIQRNPSAVDALDAGAVVKCPQHFDAVDDDPPKPPDPPDQPTFPLRPSAVETLRRLSEPRVMDFSNPRLPALAVTSLSIWDADYEREPDELRISWLRQPIRHGETERTGRPFRVRVSPGPHTIRWAVHAANMPKRRTGHWIVRCLDATKGPPVRTLAELFHELADASVTPDSAPRGSG